MAERTDSHREVVEHLVDAAFALGGYSALEDMEEAILRRRERCSTSSPRSPLLQMIDRGESLPEVGAKVDEMFRTMRERRTKARHGAKVLKRFIADRCNPTGNATVGELYEAYRDWRLKHSNAPHWTIQEFQRALREVDGIGKRKGMPPAGRRAVWEGLSLH